ncbi:ABC transporter ATP-binding protein [Cecembia calidifontis]|jgi:iron(III) transport system ATP-binding protein|uniref:Iron(III) transport system ATP-binding protein n=1 Tax=Cecembia calidifontis TaxID=1187080 RepID=A0A4Q7P7K3_9BACT|nr:ABC transporter ATP-binding protein [Cecembia calidifontis]RZS96126.1 iron(III) transport system ATP-binding protein [Cecembia calidifontis]
MTYLRLDKIQKSYENGQPVLKEFSLNLEKGQVVSLIGESGSGKSTLLRIVAGLENRNDGEVYLEGMRIANPKEKLVPGYDEIQLVYQDYHLYPNSSVEENIARPLLLYDKSYKEKRVKTLLKLLGLEKYKEKLPRQLSGGQQQKVAIGKALSLEPQVLLLDEPFSSLDTIQRRELISELREMFVALKVTVLFVTHDLDDALQMSNDLVLVQQGKLIQKGHPEEIFTKPKNLYAAKLFSHLNPLPGDQHCYIRPSDIQLYKSTGIPAKVKERQYLVHYNQLTIQLGTGEIWKVEDKKREFFPGQKIFLKWDAGKVIGPF